MLGRMLGRVGNLCCARRIRSAGRGNDIRADAEIPFEMGALSVIQAPGETMGRGMATAEIDNQQEQGDMTQDSLLHTLPVAGFSFSLTHRPRTCQRPPRTRSGLD